MILILLSTLLAVFVLRKSVFQKDLKYEIVKSSYATTFYFSTTRINKHLLRNVFGIISKHISNEKILCLVRMMVDNKSFDDITISGSFSIINEKHFIVTVLESMKSLNDKKMAYPLDHIRYFIIKIYHKPKVKSVSQLSNRRHFSTFSCLNPIKVNNLNRFMVFDIETIQIDNAFIPYAIGISSQRSFKIFYISDYEGDDFISRSKSMMKDFINHLDSIPSDKIIFAHNFGNFDGYFLLKSFLENNIKVSLLIDDMNSIITIKLRNRKKRNIIFKDSLRILPFTLRELSMIYDVEYKKLELDHNSITLDKILHCNQFRFEQLEPYLKSDL
jgi:hypothetical protein